MTLFFRFRSKHLQNQECGLTRTGHPVNLISIAQNGNSRIQAGLFPGAIRMQMAEISLASCIDPVFPTQHPVIAKNDQDNNVEER
jgi:hypothetical protein